MAEEDEGDPFGAFGDSGDSDSDKPEETHETKQAQALRQQANAGTKQSTNKEIPGDEAVDEWMNGAVPAVDVDDLQPCSLEAWNEPLYCSPNVKLVSSLPFGGGRGYVAMKNLNPGTLVLVEAALMTWPEDQLGKALTLSSVQRLLHHPNGSKIVHCLEEFHPTKRVVDANMESDSPEQVEVMLNSLHQKHKDEPLLTQLVQDAETLPIKNRDGSPLSSMDVLRIFLALRYNGLESGLYCHVAMINHKCQPNCVKFLPNTQESDLPPNCSEVRTTRWVRAGECLTISYLPRIVSHASRRRHLWDQHRFDIGAALDAGLLRMELLHGGLPPSSKEHLDDDSTTSRVEKSLTELDMLFHSVRDSLSSSPTVDAVEQAKALEVSSLELYCEAKRQLQNDNHLLLIPCLILHLDVCDLVLREDVRKTTLSPTQRCKLLVRTVASAMSLLELQRAFWGRDHFDVARTNLDLATSIQELLSKSPDFILNLETQRADLKTFRDWSTFEHKCQKDYERIKDLYPRDASKYLRKST